MKTSVFIALTVLAVVAFALTIGLVVSGGVRTAHAQPWCVDVPVNETTVEVCITFEPNSATKPVGAEHAVTAALTVDGGPYEGIRMTIHIVVGPNANEGRQGPTDDNGQFSFTYTGDGGPGVDIIEACPTDEVLRLFCSNFSLLATVEWLQPTPTPTPTPAAIGGTLPPDTPTPTPTPTPSPTLTATATATATPAPTPSPTAVLEAAQLPATGGTPSDSGYSSLPWLAVAMGGIALIGSSGAWLAYRTRRTR